MSAISLFEEKQVRRAWSVGEQKWMFAIVDVIAILTDSADPGAYWRKLMERLKKEGNETVTNCHGLKMTAADGKQRMTAVENTEQLLRHRPRHMRSLVAKIHLRRIKHAGNVISGGWNVAHAEPPYVSIRASLARGDTIKKVISTRIFLPTSMGFQPKHSRITEACTPDADRGRDVPCDISLVKIFFA